MLLIGVAPIQALTFLRQSNPELSILPQDIYNQNAIIRQVICIGQSATKALFSHLIKKGIYHRVLTINNRLTGLFISCPESIKHLQSNFDVILVDNTYSTNRFNMPLIDVIG